MELFQFVTVIIGLCQLSPTVHTCGDDQDVCGDFQPFYQKALRGHVFQTLKVSTSLGCLTACKHEARCQSFNQIMGKETCELNNRTKEAKPEDFISDRTKLYMKKPKNRVPLGSIPELPAVSCKEIKMSEGQECTGSGKYWLSSIKSDMAVLAHCDMDTEDIDECTASIPVCDDNADGCTNTLGSYVCLCKPGFTFDGKTCTDIDECTASIPVCDDNADGCNNTLGSYICLCKPGFTFDGKNCTDINECTASISVCDDNAGVCNNTLGSYICLCKPGFTGDGKNCTVFINSTILSTNQSYPDLLRQFMEPAVGNDALWLLCYRASLHGWDVSFFHSGCDGKRDTVTIIKKNKYVFGGYTDIPWESVVGYYETTSNAFIFSIHNKEGLAPFKSMVTQPAYAIYRLASYGPTFGSGFDIHIANHANSNTNSLTNFGNAYPAPSGVQVPGTILAGTLYFSPDEVEVFYLDPSH